MVIGNIITVIVQCLNVFIMNKTINGLKEGYWEYTFNSVILASKGYYVNDQRFGIWKSYEYNGNLYNMIENIKYYIL